MKIAIQGQIVDTYTICSISEEVYKKGDEYCFDVNFFNNYSLTVSIKIKEMTNNQLFEKFIALRDSLKDKQGSEEEKIKLNDYWNNYTNENKNKIEKMRQDIVNIWSNNQSSIPTFDIKKY